MGRAVPGIARTRRWRHGHIATVGQCGSIAVSASLPACRARAAFMASAGRRCGGNAGLAGVSGARSGGGKTGSGALGKAGAGAMAGYFPCGRAHRDGDGRRRRSVVPRRRRAPSRVEQRSASAGPPMKIRPNGRARCAWPAPRGAGASRIEGDQQVAGRTPRGRAARQRAATGRGGSLDSSRTSCPNAIGNLVARRHRRQSSARGSPAAGPRTHCRHRPAAAPAPAPWR